MKVNGDVPPIAVTVALPLQILPQVKLVLATVTVVAGGCIILVEYVATQLLVSTTVAVTTPAHKPDVILALVGVPAVQK